MGIKGNNINKGLSSEDLYAIAVHEIGHLIMATQKKELNDIH